MMTCKSNSLSSMLKVYTYSGCSTCKNATKWLASKKIPFQEIPIRETPPTVAELGGMLAANQGDLRALCNTSGQDYRALGMKDKLPTMTPAAVLQLLSQQGNLVKRPFAIDAAKGIFLVGFKEPLWAEKL
jgi:arsenate reductase